MDIDLRWTDDPRDRDDRGRLRAEASAEVRLSQGSRGGLSNPRERLPLDARLRAVALAEVRDVFTRDLELRGAVNASVSGHETVT